MKEVKKKILVFLSVISICLFSLFNSFNFLIVHAQEAEEFPDRYIRLNYLEHSYVQEHEQTFEYRVVYTLPFRIYSNVTINDYVLFYKYEYGFTRGVANNYNSYRLASVLRQTGYSELHFRVTLRKTMVNFEYPDGDLTRFFAEDSAMFIRSDYVNPEIVMKNFVRAEPNFDNGSLVGQWGEEKYYMYLDAYVYMPDGTKRSLTIMPDLIDDYFSNYDFVVVAFNLSPRSRFWSPDIYPSESISGLSYIVYDLASNTTTFYDYQGNSVVQLNGISYIDNPQFFVPEMEALDYQLKASYEEGKTEGYRQGREEGIRAGKRQTQEEMQKIIDDLIEQYEKEIDKAYNKGKLDGANEQFDIFAYLQALFGEQGLGRLLRLELLPGVSLGAVIMIPLAFWLVSFIMRWFR